MYVCMYVCRRCSRVIGLHTAVPGLIPGWVEIFNKDFLPEARRDGGAEPQSVPNIPGLNPQCI